MDAVIKPPPAAAIAHRFPALPIGGIAGTSFKHEHLNAILADGAQRGFFEVHAENYMGAGGPPHRALTAIRRDHPLSLHGVCMSIGGERPIDSAHLKRFGHLVERYEPALVSEHLAWSTHDKTYFNDLLPLPYTAATLARVCDHIDQVQEAIGRPMLLENPSTYVAIREIDHERDGFHPRRRQTHRMRPAARHQQCLRLRHQSRLFGARISRRFSIVACRRDSSCRSCRTGR